MPTNYFQTTQDPLDQSPFILKHSKSINSRLADTARYSIEINTSLRPLNRVKTELSQIWDNILLNHYIICWAYQLHRLELQVSDDGKSFRSLGRLTPTKFHGWQDEIWPELVKLIKDSGVSDYNNKDKGNQKFEILKWDSFLC